MNTIYVTSAETSSGKSALCVGLGAHFRDKGLKVGYMKPVNVKCDLEEGVAHDEDVAFAKKFFEMPEPFDMIAPVALTPAKLEQQLRGPETDYQPKLLEAFTKLAEDRDLLVLEGGRSLREGYVAGLPPLKVVEMLDAKVLAVQRWDDTLLIDRAMTAQNYFGKHFAGLVINAVPQCNLEFAQDVMAPFLARHGIETFGVLRKDETLSAPNVRELAEGLNAEILCCNEGADMLVTSMLVGAMGVESALSYFRRRTNKAVITGGDRADIQLAALETSTRCLVLTGNIYPRPTVLNRAEELCVPVLLTRLDTLSAVEVIGGYFGRSRFQQAQKVDQFCALLKDSFDFQAFNKVLGIEK